MRRALRYALEEFSVRQLKHVRVPWVGHDGRSGLELSPSGEKRIRHGLGVGNNYWDLLPFGGHDALATVYLHDALRRCGDRIRRSVDAWPAHGYLKGEVEHVFDLDLPMSTGAAFEKRFLA